MSIISSMRWFGLIRRRSPSTLSGSRLFLAAFLGKTRLIDNGALGERHDPRAGLEAP